MNLRPRGYEPRELPGCSTPRHCLLHCGEGLYRPAVGLDKSRRRANRSFRCDFVEIESTGEEMTPPGMEIPADDCAVIVQNSAFFGVRGNGMTSRMLAMPVMSCTRRSRPRPKPEWGTVP